MILIFSFLDDLLIAVVQGCESQRHWSKWHPCHQDSRDSRDSQPKSILVWGWERCWRSCQRPRFGWRGICVRQSAGTLLKIHHESCLMCVCGDRHEFECHLFPNVCICIYIYAYDDRYKCCSSYKCSFQLAIATQSSRCRSHPILTGNPLWMPSSSYTANLHELWHPRIHWFQYCGTSIVLRIS